MPSIKLEQLGQVGELGENMQETKVLLLKYGEIALKGLNRANFERLLEQNIISAVRNYKIKSKNFAAKGE